MESLQKFECMVRIPVTQMEQAIDCLGHIPAGSKRPADLTKAVEAMRKSIGYIERWAAANGVRIKESMHT